MKALWINTAAPNLGAERLNIIGQEFPTIHAHSLVGSKDTLPAAARGKVALISIAFERSAHAMLDSWTNLFRQAFGKNSGYVIYEVSMIDTLWGELMLSTIDSGMRFSIPEEKHPFVLTYYGNSLDIRHFLSMDDRSLGYVFLLDTNGTIQWAGKGYSTDSQVWDLINRAKELERSSDQ
ncbi:MAG: hypothetical protein ABR887_05660 [Methanoregulaceae archaeon]|jgi:hypothetical protein